MVVPEARWYLREEAVRFCHSATFSLEEEQQTRGSVTAEIAGVAPVRTAKSRLKPCMASPRLKMENTRGGDYQTPSSYLGLRDSGWKTGVLQSDTNRMSSLANGILRVGGIEPNPNQYRVSILGYMLP